METYGNGVRNIGVFFNFFPISVSLSSFLLPKHLPSHSPFPLSLSHPRVERTCVSLALVNTPQRRRRRRRRCPHTLPSLCWFVFRFSSPFFSSRFICSASADAFCPAVVYTTTAFSSLFLNSLKRAVPSRCPLSISISLSSLPLRFSSLFSPRGGF